MSVGRCLSWLFMNIPFLVMAQFAGRLLQRAKLPPGQSPAEAAW